MNLICWICHHISDGVLGVGGALNKKYPDFCWLIVSIQRPGYFSLHLC